MSAEPAIRCDETERTYAEAHERAALIAGGLATLGVGDGDTVAQVLRNSVEFMELTMGISPPPLT